MHNNTKGPDFLRKQMHAALDAGRIGRYLALRRKWLHALDRYGHVVVDENCVANANVEQPSISATLDR